MANSLSVPEKLDRSVRSLNTIEADGDVDTRNPATKGGSETTRKEYKEESADISKPIKNANLLFTNPKVLEKKLKKRSAASAPAPKTPWKDSRDRRSKYHNRPHIEDRFHSSYYAQDEDSYSIQALGYRRRPGHVVEGTVAELNYCLCAEDARSAFQHALSHSPHPAGETPSAPMVALRNQPAGGDGRGTTTVYGCVEQGPRRQQIQELGR